MEYYPALKRKEILTHATTWMNLKYIILSVILQFIMRNIYLVFIPVSSTVSKTLKIS